MRSLALDAVIVKDEYVVFVVRTAVDGVDNVNDDVDDEL